MFGFRRRDRGRMLVEELHRRVVDASRAPVLYGEGGLPDTVEGRFESLTLHVLVVLRRLRQLPPPADDVAQDLVDCVFAYLEVALRETGVGDFGVPKRMKKIAGVFYDRVRVYDAALDRRDAGAVAAALAEHLGAPDADLDAAVSLVLAGEAALARVDLDGLLAGRVSAEPPLDERAA